MSRRLAALLTSGNVVALLVLIASVGGVIWLQRRFEVDVFSREGLERLVDGMGWMGPLVYIGIIALAVVVSQLPGVPLTIAAGAVWGPVAAGIYSVIGAFIGGMIAYGLGRTLGRSVMKALTGKVVSFDTSRSERYLGWVIGLSRAVPIFSFDIISYAAGVTGLSVGVYALATLIGLLPSTFLLTYLGASLLISPVVAVSLSVAVAALLLLSPWLIAKYNLFGLRDAIHFE